jgi:hypothetical protein
MKWRFAFDRKWRKGRGKERDKREEVGIEGMHDHPFLTVLKRRKPYCPM